MSMKDDKKSVDKIDEDLGANIAKAVIDQFNKLKVKSGKPVIRSNGVNEWTVVAGLVALIPENNNYEIVPISISTGVKAMPDKCRSYSNGTIVHDMHAEILAIRLFNWFLLNECTKLESNSYESRFIERIEVLKFKWKPNIKLALYISEPPCGDASMSIVTESLQDNDPWENTPTKRAKIEGGSSILRGRAHINRVGIVRTKPGRADSLVSLSKSCSDKLCLKQITGILNCMTHMLFPDNIFLDYLVMKRDKINKEDLNRCFVTRLSNKPELGRKLNFLTYDEDEYQFHKPDSSIDSSPSPLSLLFVVPTKTLQVLNNGVKNGSYVKNKPPRSGGESHICNRKLFEVFKKVRKDIPFRTYKELKLSSADRSKLKEVGHKALGDWPRTQDDDFDLQC